MLIEYNIWTEYIGIPVLFLFSLLCGTVITDCKNPIFSLICLIMSFTGIILIFLILKIEFLALTFLIIYIGAIAILFLFVIMMFNLKQLDPSFEIPADDEEFYCFSTAIIIFFFKYQLVIALSVEEFIHSSVFNVNKQQVVCNYEELLYIIKYKNNDILLLSDFLYTSHGYLFILTGVILLASMFGSIVLAMLSQNKNFSSKFINFYNFFLNLVFLHCWIKPIIFF